MNFYIVSLIKAAVVAGALLTTLAYLQWIERKVLAHVQLRLGPYRVGPHGLLQPLADVIKLLTKEDLYPPYVSGFLYFFAPFLAIALSLSAIAVIPFGPEITVFGIRTHMQLTDLDVGLLYILAISSLGVYAVALAGWASNNKYSLLGGLRASAQMISYELPMALALAAPLLLLNTLSLRGMVDGQAGYYLGILPRWSIFQGPWPQIFGFVLFLIAGFAETNRLPFDLPEAESELVAGFHTEYSSMKFAAFFMAEYCNMITLTSVAALLFLGGWHPLFPAAYGSDYVAPLLFAGGAVMCFYHGLNPARRRDRYTLPVFGVVFLAVAAALLFPPLKPVLIPLFWFAAKVLGLLFVFIWVRGTLPRFRYDQLMRFAWGVLFPVAMLNLLVTGVLVALF
ncbi:MAG: NADH-quinone oxidoreductase subunit NuoH [Bryobacterales bacterium]|nr:NADH-quinone oxidoreductase subunit NuoH [Bryobacterales bacterium]